MSTFPLPARYKNMAQAPHDAVDVAGLVHRHQKGVWRYLRSLGCEAALADDLTQETFLAVLRRPFVEISPAATSGYLRQVARNLLVTHRRRSHVHVPLEVWDEIDRQWSRWEDRDDGEAWLAWLRECLTSLSERARLGIDLRYRDQKSRDEIAAALDLTPDGAKNLLQRAKQSLRECIERKMKDV